MASANIQKLHGRQAVQVLGHDARWDGRKGVDYTNTIPYTADEIHFKWI